MCFARSVEGFRAIQITGVYILVQADLDNNMHSLPCKGKIPREKGFFGGYTQIKKKKKNGAWFFWELVS